MENIIIPPSDRTPEVYFDFANGRLSIKGESYPGDALAFFGPLISALHTYFKKKPGCAVIMDLDMEYFNSSSAKALMNIFLIMDEAAEEGTNTTIRWHYNEGDDTMQEYGEDFSEDLQFLSFEMVRAS